MSDDEYDYDNYGYEQDQMDVEDNEQIELENNFNMAEDEWRTNPEKAYHLFTQVIEKEKSKSLDSRKWSFKSYNFMILMGIQKKINEVELTSYITGFLELLDKQFKSEGDKALKMVVDALLNSNDGHLLSTVLPGLLSKLHQMNQIGVYCSASMKLCKDFYQRKDASKLEEIINNVENILTTSNIQDEDRKKAVLSEALAYRVLLSNLTNKFDDIKSIYRQLMRSNLDLLEPYIVGVINQTIGQQKSLERQYEQGRKKLMEAFYFFQDASSPEAKQSLVYGSVVSILENFKMNVFDDMRSKVYEKDPYVETFKELRTAYEQQNVQVFSNIINSDYFKNDRFLVLLKPYMQQIIVECKILRYAKCYKTIRLDYLSKQLMIDVPVLQKYIQGLITKKQFNGLIDEVAGYIEIRGDEEENQTKALKIIVDQIRSIDQ